MSYADFLASKRRRAAEVGITVDPADLHPTLFPHQRTIVAWALRKGRAAIWADTGLGKTRMQLEWADRIARRSLVIAPLSVARQTVREAHALGIDASYVRSDGECGRLGVCVTNYEMADRFDPDRFDAVVLDESSILKNVDGATRRTLTDLFASVRHRLACTATPAPNDVAELCNHAEFLGVMPRNEMLAAYFVHDEDGWRLKGHAAEPMYRWMGTWAVALRKPSDLGPQYDDSAYELPELRIHAEVVDVDTSPPEGQMFGALGGVTGRARVRRETLAARVERAAELVGRQPDDQWIAWCGLNEEADRLTDAIPGAVNLHGTLSPDRKAEIIEAFQDGAIAHLVTKPVVAGYGLNLQMAHRQVFVGLGDSYEAYYQAIRRSWRFGQVHPVDVHVVVSAVEQEIVANVRRKETGAQHSTDQLIRCMTMEEAA